MAVTTSNTQAVAVIPNRHKLLLVVALCVALSLQVPGCLSAGTVASKRVTYLYTGAIWNFNSFPFASINTSHFTHVIVAFSDISPSFQVVPDSASAARLSELTTYLHAASPPVRVLYSIASSKFASMSTSAASRATFIASAIATARKYGFDGIDLDWQFPSGAAQRSQFSSLLREMRTAVNRAIATDRAMLLLTAAVSCWQPNIPQYYEVDVLARTLNWVNIMTYDMAGTWDGVTGEHTALQRPSRPDLSIAGSISAWSSLGMPLSSMVVGLATYGRAYSLANRAVRGVGANTTGASSYGAFMHYNTIVNNFLSKGATAVFDPVTSSMYAYLGSDWVGYDNPNTIGIKATYIKKTGVAGYMFWSYTGDDSQQCLQAAANKAWQSS